jgi:hypothetical protein
MKERKMIGIRGDEKNRGIKERKERKEKKEK